MSGIAGWFGSAVRDGRAWQRALGALGNREQAAQGLAFFSLNGARWSVAELQGTGVFLQTRQGATPAAPDGIKPLSNRDGSVWIVLDGEIYGWESERADLEALGHHFRDGAGAEFILNGYCQWGEAILDHLRGIFAFAILDLKRQVVFCARDHVGRKPFYWRWNHGTFSFASSVRALRELDLHINWEVSSAGIDAYLAHRYIPAPQTIYRDVCKLPAAHRMTVALRVNAPAPIPFSFWKPKSASGDASVVLDEAIRLRMQDTSRLGIFLSADVESTAVAAGCVRAKAKGTLLGFTAGFALGAEQEGAASVRGAARSLGLSHEFLDVLVDADELPRIVRDFDEPFGDSKALLMWHLCRGARAKVGAAMTGVGGGEFFNGRARYAEHLRIHGNASRKKWIRLLPAKAPSEWKSKTSISGRMLHAAAEARMDWSDAYVLRFPGIEPVWRSFLQPDLSVPPPHYWMMPTDLALDPLDWMIECDRLNFLPECALRREDLSGRAHGMEIRAPLLDHHFVDALLGIPPEQRFSGSSEGWLGCYAGTVCTDVSTIGPVAAPIGQWSLYPLWKRWMADCSRELQTMTNGQISETRCSQIISNPECPPETVWQLVSLRLSLESLISEI